MDLSIIIPCYNEADSVAMIVDQIEPVLMRLRHDRSVELIIVDDGSTDGTGDLLTAHFHGDDTIRVIRHERNRGLGAALRTGFEAARGAIVVTADSDATYPFLLMIPLLERLTPGTDIVTGSCYHPEGRVADVPAYRVALSRGASFTYRLLVDHQIHTYTCLFRAYRREVVSRVSFNSNGFLAVTELLVNARLAGYRVAEMPCTLRVRRYGQSKARVLQIIRSHLAFQWQLVSRHGRPWRRLPSAQPSRRGI